MELELVSGKFYTMKTSEFTTLVEKGVSFKHCYDLFHTRVWEYGDSAPDFVHYVEIGRIPFHQEDAFALGLEVDTIL